jgi:hypothetical protein
MCIARISALSSWHVNKQNKDSSACILQPFVKMKRLDFETDGQTETVGRLPLDTWRIRIWQGDKRRSVATLVR